MRVPLSCGGPAIYPFITAFYFKLAIVKTLLFSLIAIACSTLLVIGFSMAHLFYAVPAKNSETVEVRIDQGDSLAAVVRKLRERNIILNERLFSTWARMTGVEKKIHWGVYRFDTSLPAGEILNRMVMGKGIFNSVTVPEGLTVNEIADLLAKMQIADKDKFLAAASDPELLTSLGLQETGIEGYLFPNTYHFTPATDERDIISAMTAQFRKVSSPLLEQSGGAVQMTPHEIVTLASIIEKETGVEAERPLVSAVFHNRLKLHMPLQSDPTVIYGLKNFNGNLTHKDLRDPSPYNTYRIAGLPPGPIANPGLSSLRAALNPANVPFLYFVSKNDGTHLFSETLEAHNHAVKTYQPRLEPSPERKIASRRP